MKIKNYSELPIAKPTDIVIGSDGTTGATKNIKVSDIMALAIGDGVESFYNALLTQSSTNDPTSVELLHNPIGVLNWKRYAEGVYSAEKTGAFNGTPVLIYGSSTPEFKFTELSLMKVNDDEVRLYTRRSSVDAGYLISTSTDGLLTNRWIKIINVI